MTTNILSRRGPTHEQALKQLGDIYDELNKTRFSGELPRTPIIKIHVGPNAGEFRLIKEMLVAIFFSPFVEPKDYRRVMTHEMCHFYDSGHGAVFKKKLAQVADGQPWLQEELDACEGRQMRDRVRANWNQIVFRLAGEQPTMNWQEARRFVALELGCKVSFLRDVAYDFKECWSGQVQLVLVGKAKKKAKP